MGAHIANAQLAGVKNLTGRGPEARLLPSRRPVAKVALMLMAQADATSTCSRDGRGQKRMNMRVRGSTMMVLDECLFQVTPRTGFQRAPKKKVGTYCWPVGWDAYPPNNKPSCDSRCDGDSASLPDQRRQSNQATDSRPERRHPRKTKTRKRPETMPSALGTAPINLYPMVDNLVNCRTCHGSTIVIGHAARSRLLVVSAWRPPLPSTARARMPKALR